MTDRPLFCVEVWHKLQPPGSDVGLGFWTGWSGWLENGLDGDGCTYSIHQGDWGRRVVCAVVGGPGRRSVLPCSQIHNPHTLTPTPHFFLQLRAPSRTKVSHTTMFLGQSDAIPHVHTLDTAHHFPSSASSPKQYVHIHVRRA